MIRECKLYFHYKKLNIRPSIISKTGSFSRYDENSGILIIGDGEEAEIGFGATEQNANWTFTAPQIVHKDPTSPVSLNAGSSERTYKLTHPTDTVTQEYLVDRDCWFEYKGTRRTITWGRQRTSRSLPFIWVYEFYRYPFVPGTNLFEGTELVHGRHSNIDRAMAGELPDVIFRTQMFDTQKRIKTEDFEKNTDWYAPEVTLWARGPARDDYDHWDHYDSVQINKWAKKIATDDKTVKSLIHTDNLVLSYKHNGKDKTMTIPVYIETRNCPYNQQ